MSFTKPYEYQDGDSLYDHSDDILNDLKNNQSELHDRAAALNDRSLVQEGVSPTFHFDFANQRYSKWTSSGTLNTNVLTDVAYFVRGNITGGTAMDGRIVDVASGEPVYDYRGGICRGLYCGSNKTSLCGTPLATLQTSQSGQTTEVVPGQIYNTTAVNTTWVAGYVERIMADFSDGDYLLLARISNKTGASGVVRMQPVHYNNTVNGNTRTTIDINFDLYNMTTSTNYPDFLKDSGIVKEGDSGIYLCWAVVIFSGVTDGRHRLRHDSLDDSSYNIHGFDAYRYGMDTQLIQGAVAGTTYIGDLCYMDLGDEYNSKEGTYITEFFTPDYFVDRHFFATFRDQNIPGVGLVILSNGVLQLRTYNGNDVYTNITTLPIATKCRIAIAYENGGQYIYVSANGGDVVTVDVGVDMSIQTRIYPSSNDTTSYGQWGSLRSSVSQSTYYPKCLSQTAIKNLSKVL